jgi:hypothetical protein
MVNKSPGCLFVCFFRLGVGKGKLGMKSKVQTMMMKKRKISSGRRESTSPAFHFPTPTLVPPLSTIINYQSQTTSIPVISLVLNLNSKILKILVVEFA